jgi:phosphonate transport system ATP-binding protein
MTAFRFRGETLWRGPAAVLAELHLHLEPGEKVALLGPSGAGKTTLLEALRARALRETAWCPQEPALVPALSVFHNIYMGALERHGSLYNLLNLIRPTAVQKQRVGELARELELADKLRVSVDRLSGGQAQRTALGRALYSERPVLLADEPVSSLDEEQAGRLLRLALARHDTAVVALHHQDQALTCFDRVIGLAGGRVQLDAPAAALGRRDLTGLYQ